MKISTLIDANVLIDAIGPEHLAWRNWSLEALKRALDVGDLILSPVVWAELASPGRSEGALARSFAWLRPRREDFRFRRHIVPVSPIESIFSEADGANVRCRIS